MKRSHFIAMDTHCQFCEVAWSSKAGRKVFRNTVQTSIPQLVDAINEVPRPRTLVFEEGPIADWLFRGLKDHVNELIVCDPRRNALIAKDGDKDDPIDAEKLLHLARGGYLRAVHHCDSEDRALFKQRVGLYHEHVAQRVRVANRIMALLRRWGIFQQEAAFADPASRDPLFRSIDDKPVLCEDLTLLFERYDVTCRHEHTMRQRVIKHARGIDQVQRFCALPGVKWIRASTFYAYIDTPYRFRKKQKLWRYLGIGLMRHQSGDGPVKLRTPRHGHPLLKNMILGAAQSALLSTDNPFVHYYERRTHDGASHRIAKRDVARQLATVMWGMWKSKNAYRADWVGAETGTAS